MKGNQRLFAVILAVMFVCTSILLPGGSNSVEAASSGTKGSTEVFYEDFNGTSLNRDDWLIACKSWGSGNGGVVPENVSVANGKLVLTAHGDLYKGPLKGADHYGNRVSKTTRVGAAIATRKYYSSGSYEMRAKIAPELGACSAMWSFEYEETSAGIVNHEIDIELPGRPGSSLTDIGFDYALFSTYQTESAYTLYTKLDKPLNDNQFHIYRYDWHTGGAGNTARVEFYIDNVLKAVSYKKIPTNAGRLWIGLWFPNKWAGNPNFDTTSMEVDYVKIIPYDEPGDTPEHETYGKDGWAPDTFWEVGGGSQPDIEEPSTEEPKPEDPGIDAPTSGNLLVNGDFAAGAEGWKLTGSAKVADGKAILASGNDTDEIKQTVSVERGTTYKLFAAVTTPGASLDISVKDFNGRYTSKTETVTKSGLVELEFTTASHIDTITVEGTVLRYQDCKDDCSIDWMYLTKDLSYKPGEVVEPTEPETPELPEEPEQPEVPDVPETPEEPTEPEEPVVANLLVNGNFADGASGWKTSGGTVIQSGKAILASGKDTDTLKQSVNVTGGKTYVLTAQVTSPGPSIEVGVNDYNGRYTKINDVKTADGKVEITFTVASHMKKIEVYAEVLRYQNSDAECSISNIVLQEK